MRNGYYFPLFLSTAVNAFDTNNASPELTCTAVKPAPSGCGVRGDIPYQQHEAYPASSPQIVSSVNECANLCDRRVAIPEYYGYFYYDDVVPYQPYCMSFRYTPSTGECTLGQLAVEDIVVASNKSKSLFFDYECFDCGKICTASQPLHSELVDNGGFEEELLGPWLSDLGALTKGYKSPKAYHCAPGNEGDCSLSQEVNMCPGEYYSVQFDYVTIHTENFSNKLPYVHMGFGGLSFSGISGTGFYSYKATTNNTDRNAWKTIKAYFLYRKGEHTGPTFKFGGDGETLIDNVKASRIPAKFPLVQPQVNPFKNSGFETGDLPPWNPDYRDKPANKIQKRALPPWKIISPGISSKYAISWTSKRGFVKYLSRVLAQTVKTKPDTTYLLSFDSQSQDIPYTVSVKYGLGDVESEILYTGVEGRFTFSVPVVATTNMTEFRLQVVSGTTDGGQRILLDNFRLLEIKKSAFST